RRPRLAHRAGTEAQGARAAGRRHRAEAEGRRRPAHPARTGLPRSSADPALRQLDRILDQPARRRRASAPRLVQPGDRAGVVRRPAWPADRRCHRPAGPRPARAAGRDRPGPGGSRRARRARRPRLASRTFGPAWPDITPGGGSMNTESDEFRRASRHDIPDTVRVVDAMTDKIVGKLGNISETGMLLIASVPLVDDALYQFRLEIDEGRGQVIEVGAHMLWQDRASAEGQTW